MTSDTGFCPYGNKRNSLQFYSTRIAYQLLPFLPELKPEYSYLNWFFWVENITEMLGLF